MKFLISLTVVFFSMYIFSTDREFLKFVTAKDKIILYTKDIIEIDEANSLITLSEDAKLKIEKIHTKNLQAYVLDLNKKWVKVDILEARNSKINLPLNIESYKGKLLFYSGNQLVIGGKLWVSIAKSLNIKINPNGSDMR